MVKAALVVAVATVVALGVGGVVGGPVVFGMPALFWTAVVALTVNWFAFVPAWMQQTERYYDLTGSLTSLTLMASCTAVAVLNGTFSLVSAAAACAAVIWAGRLGLFLVRRIHRDGKDGRFDAIKTSGPRFLVAWTLQGLWVFLTTLAAQALVLTGPAVGFWVVLGAVIWLGGFGIEVVADRQKTAFRNDPANDGRFIDSGLWSWSRHPNYAGEITLWTGMFLAGCGTWAGGQWLTALSPVFVVFLLTKVSGIPLLEARADERWGDDPAYQAYKRGTPVLFPWPR